MVLIYLEQLDKLRSMKLRIHHFFIMVILTGFISVGCEKDTLNQSVSPYDTEFDSNALSGDNIPVLSPYFFKGVVDSTEYFLQLGINNYSNYLDAFVYDTCDSVRHQHVQKTGLYRNTGRNNIIIGFNKCVLDSFTAPEQIADMWQEKSYFYGNSSKKFFEEGVEIEWIDANGESWKTTSGTGQKFVNRFEIEEVVAGTGAPAGNVIIKGNMDVKLYKKQKSIRISQAKFNLPIGTY